MKVMSITISEISATYRFKLVVILISILIGFGAIVNRGLLTIAIALIVLTAIMRGYTKLCIHIVSNLRVSIPSYIGYEGEEKVVEISIENPTYIPIAFLEISINYSPFLKLVGGTKSALLLIPPRGKAVVKLVFNARLGRHVVGPIKTVVRDPLGLYRSSEIMIGRKSYLEIYPRVSETVVRKLLVFTRSTGIVRTRQRGSGVEIHSIREYTPYDDVRRILWKYYASKRKLVVKDTERETMQNILFILDATPPMFIGPYGYTPFEHCSRTIASIARYLAHRGDLMGIAIFTRKYIEVSPRFERGMKGYKNVINYIKNIDFDTDDTDDSVRALRIEGLFRKTISMLPRERSIIFIFTTSGGKTYREILAKYVNILREMMHEIYIVIPITTIYEIKGLPEWGQAIFRIKTYEAMKREIEFANSLKHMGIDVIAAGPQHIPQLIVSMIEMRRY